MFAQKFDWRGACVVAAMWSGLLPAAAFAGELTRLSAHQVTPGEAQIYAALKEPSRMDCLLMPLMQLPTYLGDLHKISVKLDGPAVDEAGIYYSAPFSTNMTGISLSSALGLALKPLGMDYVVHGESLVITTNQALEQITYMRSYPVGDLLDAAHDAEQLAEVVRATIVRPAKARPIPSDSVVPPNPRVVPRSLVTYRDLLIVRDTPRVHEEVVELLTQMHRMSKTPVETADKGS